MKIHFEDKYKNTGLTAFFVIAASICFSLQSTVLTVWLIL